jgi:uncharacterized membrane protein
MRSYHAARAVFSLFSALAWIMILIGIVAVFGGFSAGRQINPYNPDLGVALVAVPGALVSIFGFVMLVLAQMGRAGVDTAEYSQQMLKASRDHMEVSQQLVRQGEKLEQGYAALASKIEAASAASYAGKLSATDAVPLAQATTTLLTDTKVEMEPAKVRYEDRLRIENGVALADVSPSLAPEAART